MTRKRDAFVHVAGRDIPIRNGQYVIERKLIDTQAPGDYGADPLGDGTFRMVPSGDIVDLDERNRRLRR